jgi:hypothetical protein
MTSPSQHLAREHSRKLFGPMRDLLAYALEKATAEEQVAIHAFAHEVIELSGDRTYHAVVLGLIAALSATLQECEEPDIGALLKEVLGE